jgi:hypothetical protein
VKRNDLDQRIFIGCVRGQFRTQFRPKQALAGQSIQEKAFGRTQFRTQFRPKQALAGQGIQEKALA